MHVDGAVLCALQLKVGLEVGMPRREPVPTYVALEENHVAGDSLSVEHASQHLFAEGRVNLCRSQFYSGLGADVDVEWDVICLIIFLILRSPSDRPCCVRIGYIWRCSERCVLKGQHHSILLHWFVVFKRGLEECVVRTSESFVVLPAETEAKVFFLVSSSV